MGGAASLLCAVVFVPRLGVYGALIALAAAAVAGVCYFSVALFRSERIHPFTWPYAKTLAAAAASLALVFKIVPAPETTFCASFRRRRRSRSCSQCLFFLTGAFTEKDKRMALRFRGWVERGEMWPSRI